MEEASGLAYSKRQDAILWTQNDHGDDARVIALSDEGQRISIVNLEGVKNEDWEDIATTLIGSIANCQWYNSHYIYQKLEMFENV